MHAICLLLRSILERYIRWENTDLFKACIRHICERLVATNVLFLLNKVNGDLNDFYFFVKSIAYLDLVAASDFKTILFIVDLT